MPLNTVEVEDRMTWVLPPHGARAHTEVNRAWWVASVLSAEPPSWPSL